MLVVPVRASCDKPVLLKVVRVAPPRFVLGSVNDIPVANSSVDNEDKRKVVFPFQVAVLDNQPTRPYSAWENIKFSALNDEGFVRSIERGWEKRRWWCWFHRVRDEAVSSIARYKFSRSSAFVNRGENKLFQIDFTHFDLAGTNLYDYPRAFGFNDRLSIGICGFGNTLDFFRLVLNRLESFQSDDSSPESGEEQRPVRPRFWRESLFKNALRFLLGALLFCGGAELILRSGDGSLWERLGFFCFFLGALLLFSPVPWWR